MTNKRSSAKASAMRLIHMILAIPTDAWVSTSDVHRILQARGFTVHKTTVCRDLKSLTREFDIVCKRVKFGEEYMWHRRRGLE